MGPHKSGFSKLRLKRVSHEPLSQAAYQEPDASFLSRGAETTAGVVAARLLHWEGKPQAMCAVQPHARPTP
jgi:hypothetical protein